MIIQHNIMAINSHRQLGINNTNLGKNLEKLSSGYRINRAADDASGLAVSEKMRAQITGLERAISNAQDGSSLIQTAEGALQEVHSMLNRMVELATQSANGTYQADDRQKIEAEVTALKDEIDRISKSTNFNGIALLDGSLATSTPKSVDVSGVRVQETAAEAGEYVFTTGSIGGSASTSNAGGLAQGDELSYTISLNNGESYTMKFTVSDDGRYLTSEDGTLYSLGTSAGATGTSGAMAQSSVAIMLETELRKTAVNNDFVINANATGLEITNRVAGTAATQITGISMNKNDTNVNIGLVQTTFATPTDDVREIMMSDMVVFSYGGGVTNEEQATFTVNGEKFILVNAASLASNSSYADAVAQLTNKGVNVISVNGTAGGNPVNADLHHIAADINFKTGMDFKLNGIGAAADGLLVQAPKLGNGLTMQVGDTADDWNKITVSVDDMSSTGLNISNISMATQEAASNALTKIKSAIEKVSVNRGNLGALQNRLEYTMNNLGVTTENMTAAESRIRDTDMAKEMMAFTKNNVLAQAAQAMLAQANQQPQQVLQLLR